MDQVAAGKDARGKEYGLPEGRLVSRGKAGNQAGVCGVGMEEVDEQGEDWAQRTSLLALLHHDKPGGCQKRRSYLEGLGQTSSRL